jgi:hypothetical protein
MAGDRKHHKRSKRLNKVSSNKSPHKELLNFILKLSQDGSKQNHVSFPEFQQNGSAKQLANGTNSSPLSFRKKFKRKHNLNHKKYHRLEIGNNNCIAECKPRPLLFLFLLMSLSMA